MKTLVESLFDRDLVKRKVLLGDVYELSPVSHHNMVTNDIWRAASAFDGVKLEKAKFPFHVDKNNSFVVYFSQQMFKLPYIIDAILSLPYICFDKNKNNKTVEVSDEFKKLLKPYLVKNQKKIDDTTIWLKPIHYSNGNVNYELDIVNGISKFTPDHITLTFVPK